MSPRKLIAQLLFARHVIATGAAHSADSAFRLRRLCGVMFTVVLVAALSLTHAATVSRADVPCTQSDGSSLGPPSVAISGNGETIANAWVMFNGSNKVVRTRYSTNAGKKWSDKNLSNASTNAIDPQVAVSDDGQTIAYVWATYDTSGPGGLPTSDQGGYSQAIGSYTTDGGKTWQNQTLSSTTTQAVSPAVAVSGNGDTITYLWVANTVRCEPGGFFTQLGAIAQTRTSTDGGNSWVNADVSAQVTTISNPSVRVDDTGQTTVYAWNLNQNGSRNWQTRYRTNVGDPLTTFDWPSSDGLPDGVARLQSAVSGNGQAIVFAWADVISTPAQNGVTVSSTVQSRYTLDGGANWIARDVSFTPDSVLNPRDKEGAGSPGDISVAVSDTGATVAYGWARYRAGGFSSQFSTDSGATWAEYNPVGSGTKVVGPRVSVSGDGTTLAYLWAGGQSKKLTYKWRYSTNSGSSWSKTKSDGVKSNQFFGDVLDVSDTGKTMSVVWALGAGGEVAPTVQTRYSSNGGGKWTKVNVSGSSSVKKLKAASVAKKSATIKWKKPAQVDSNGVKKYQVRYKSVKAKKWKSWKSAKPKKLKVSKKTYAKSLNKLKPKKKYLVQVRSKNSVSPGTVNQFRFKTKK